MAGATVSLNVARCALDGPEISGAAIANRHALEEIIQRHHPDACAIEDGFLATNVKVTLKLGQVRGVAMLVAERAALEIHEYSPRLVKQTVSVMATLKVSGSANGENAALVEERS